MIATVVSPVTQIQEGSRRAGTDTQLLGFTRASGPSTEGRIIVLRRARGHRAARPSLQDRQQLRQVSVRDLRRPLPLLGDLPVQVVRGLAGRPAASATAMRSLTDLYKP